MSSATKKYEGFNEPIMVVDDEPDVRAVVVEEIEELGLQVISLGSADEALGVLRTQDVCIILSDFKMPGMNGVEFCTAARKLKPDVPFILLTAYMDKPVAISSLKSGVSDVLEKPFAAEDLRKMVQARVDAKIEAIERELRELADVTAAFVEEASVLVESLESNILRLDEGMSEPAVVDLLFRNVHSIKGGAGAIPGGKWLAQIGHAFESCLALIKKGSLRPTPDVVEGLLLASDLSQKLFFALKEGREPEAELLQALESGIKVLNQLASGEAAPSASTAAGPAPTAAREIEAKSAPADKAEKDEGVWVTNEKLDSFMKISGELIVLKNYFHVLNQENELRSLSPRVSGKLTDLVGSLNKLTDHLQDQIMSIRKVTLERALSKLPRIFRQVTRELNKRVKLTTEGFELGVDRTIANSLSTCMTHMLRNAIDHGIEGAESRTQRGKLAEASVTIQARERQGIIHLSISDDGGGIDRERVAAKAVEKGLIDEARRAALTEEETYDLLFLPGFSTSAKVTGISGRGVGMDVVKSEILNLNGKIRIESALGVGTTFHIEVPIPKTVMVEQTVLVKSEGALIALPLTSIAQMTKTEALDTAYVGHQRTCQFQGQTVSLCRYAEILDASGLECATTPSDESAGLAVILQHKTHFLGLLVDSVHNQLEAVIRPFDKITNAFPGFKGTTVLGDDTIAYVISPEEFVSLGLKLPKNGAA